MAISLCNRNSQYVYKNYFSLPESNIMNVNQIFSITFNYSLYSLYVCFIIENKRVEIDCVNFEMF